MTVICDAPASTGRRVTPGSWSRDDVIVIPSPDSPTTHSLDNKLMAATVRAHGGRVDVDAVHRSSTCVRQTACRAPSTMSPAMDNAS